MIGPTGVGKTEIARRLARWPMRPSSRSRPPSSPRWAMSADVDSIIRDLAEWLSKQTREAEMKKVRTGAEDAAEERILDVLIPPARAAAGSEPADDNAARQVFRKKAARRQSGRQGDRDRRGRSAPSSKSWAPGMEEMAEQLRGMFSQLGQDKRKTRKLKIAEALKLITDEEAAKLVNEEEIKTRAVQNAEQNGIVFIDEIDKVAARQESSGADVSRQGVQRDLLPLVEGTTVSTKYGMIKTDHILFIASGAFHLSKPSDLIPELQGRFRSAWSWSRCRCRTSRPSSRRPMRRWSSSTRRLLATEGVTLEFAPRASPPGASPLR